MPVRTMSVSVRTEKEVGILYKEMTRQYPNMERKMNVQIHESQRTTKQINYKYFFTKTYFNQCSKAKDKEYFEGNEKNNLLQTGEPPLDLHQTSQQKALRPAEGI